MAQRGTRRAFRKFARKTLPWQCRL